MKRILIFSTAFHPFVGGAEVAVKEITDRMLGFEFDLITLNLDSQQKSVEQIGNVKVYRIGTSGKISKLLFPFIAFIKAQSLHKKNNYDATWSIMASYSGFAALFFKYYYKKVTFVLTLQEGDPIPYIKRRVKFVYPLFKDIFRKADYIQAISHYLAQFAKDMGARSEVVVIPNGVDVELFSEVIHKPHDGTVLITTSRLVEKNAVGDVIEALTQLPEQVSFLVLGIGELENKLRKQVEYLKLENRVHFIGQVAYENIPAYLAMSDIFIRPSLSEGMGNSFIEAMAARVPVIATNVGGIPDFLKDKETGIFCEVKNPESIARAVTFYLENKELREKIINGAHTLVSGSYDWDLIAKKMKTEIFARV